jgi:hypothetical protein
LHAFSTSSAAFVDSVERQPRIVPWSRRCRVSARVSMPESPGSFFSTSSASSVPVDRQLLGISHRSRHTMPCARRSLLSMSSAFTP